MSAIIIETINDGEAPVNYKLAAGQSIEATAITATFDGAAAAGDFVPAVAFYAQDGKLQGRIPAGAAIAPGASDEVTWFPFVGGASGQGVDEVTSPGDTITVTDPFGPVVKIDWPYFVESPAEAYDGDSLTDISAAFVTIDVSLATLIPGRSFDTGMPEGTLGLGNFAYEVLDPTQFLTHAICIPLSPGLFASVANLRGIERALGVAQVIDASTGDRYPCLLERKENFSTVLALRLIGFGGGLVTATNPIALAAGDQLVGSWTADIRGE